MGSSFARAVFCRFHRLRFPFRLGGYLRYFAVPSETTRHKHILIATARRSAVGTLVKGTDSRLPAPRSKRALVCFSVGAQGRRTLHNTRYWTRTQTTRGRGCLQGRTVQICIISSGLTVLSSPRPRVSMGRVMSRFLAVVRGVLPRCVPNRLAGSPCRRERKTSFWPF